MHQRYDNAIKVASACTVTAFLVALLHIPVGGIAVLSILVLNTVYVKEPVTKGWQRFLGAFACSIVAMIYIHLLINIPLVYFIALAATFLILSYCFRCGYYPYAALIGAVTLAFLMTEALVHPNTIDNTAIGWCVSVGLALAITWLFDQFWPIYRPMTLSQEFIALICQRVNDPEPYFQLRQRIRASHPKRQVGYLALLHQLPHLFAYAEQVHDAPEFERIFSQSLQAIQHALQNHTALSLLSYRMKAYRDVCVVRVAIARREGVYSALSDQKVLETISHIAVLERCIELLESIEIQLNMLASTRELAQYKIHSLPPWAKPLDSDALKSSIKMTLGVGLLFALQQFFSWPIGVQGIIAVTVLTATPNLGRAHWKFRLRVVGILVGSLFGLLCLLLTMHIPTLAMLLLLIFVAMAIAAYIALGDERSSYFGVQFGVMIPMMLMMTTGPSLDLSLPFERFVGVIVAACVAALILHLLWPKEPYQMMLTALKKSRQAIGQFIAALIDGDDNSMLMAIGGIEHSDHTLLRDSAFLLYQRDQQFQQQKDTVTLLNTFSRHARVLTHALSQLQPAIKTPALRLLHPMLCQMQAAIFHNGEQSLSVSARGFIAKLRRRKITKRINTQQLQYLTCIESMLLKLCDTLDLLIQQQRHQHNNKERIDAKPAIH